MEVKLDRKDMTKAVELFLNDKGISTEDKDIKCSFGREVVTVDIEDKTTENAAKVPDQPFGQTHSDD